MHTLYLFLPRYYNRMAKANYRAASLIDSVRSGFESFSDALLSGFFNSVNREADLIMDRLEERAFLFQERLVRKLASSLLVGIAGIFLISSAYFYLVEFRQMSRTGAFFLLGVLLLIAGWLMKKYGGAYNAEAKKYRYKGY